MRISLIAAVADNGVIGQGNSLPWSLPADLAHFKRTTLGAPVVMGRCTFESIGRTLPQRHNIVVTRNTDFVADGADTAGSFAAALALATAGGAAEVFVIGGAGLYAAALPAATRFHLTEVHARIDGDRNFPDWNRRDWRETSRQERAADARNAWPLSFVVLERNEPATG